MVDTNDAADMREKLVAELLTQEKIVSETVETAFRRIPRQQFMPQRPIQRWPCAALC